MRRSAHRPSRAVLGIGVLAALAFVRCSNVLGLDKYRPTPGRMDAGANADAGGPAETTCTGPAFPTSACRDCVDANCCDESKACAADPLCRALRECVGACAPEDAECRGACNAETPYGFSEVTQALVRCTANSCNGCGLTPVAIGDERCNSCMEGACANEVTAYSKDRDALVYGNCPCDAARFSDCPCAGADAPGKALNDAVTACVNDRCSTDCGPRNVWGCLGHSILPPPDPAMKTLELHVQVRDGLCVNTLTNFTVRACAALDPTCSAKLDEQPTDPQGRAVLTLSSSGTSPHFEKPFTGFVLFTTPDPGYPEQMAFVSPPIRATTWFNQCVGTKALWDAAGSAVGIPTDWTKGVIFFSVLDCWGNPVPGAVVESQPAAPVTYFGSNATPVKGLTETSSVAQGTIGPIEPGTVRVIAHLGEAGAPIAVYDVLTRAGTVTSIPMHPTE